MADHPHEASGPLSRARPGPPPPAGVCRCRSLNRNLNLSLNRSFSTPPYRLRVGPPRGRHGWSPQSSSVNDPRSRNRHRVRIRIKASRASLENVPPVHPHPRNAAPHSRRCPQSVTHQHSTPPPAPPTPPPPSTARASATILRRVDCALPAPPFPASRKICSRNDLTSTCVGRRIVSRQNNRVPARTSRPRPSRASYPRAPNSKNGDAEIIERLTCGSRVRPWTVEMPAEVHAGPARRLAP
jgi:hypothetical protein